jgi:hypothetical protein
MTMKHAKTLLETFETKVFQEGDVTFGEVIKGKEVIVTVAQGPNRNQLFSWVGKAHARNGKIRFTRRSTSYNNLAPFDFEVELNRALFLAIVRAFKDEAAGRF